MARSSSAEASSFAKATADKSADDPVEFVSQFIPPELGDGDGGGSSGGGVVVVGLDNGEKFVGGGENLPGTEVFDGEEDEVGVGMLEERLQALGVSAGSFGGFVGGGKFQQGL